MRPLPANTEESAKYEETIRKRQRHAIYPALLGGPLTAPTNVVYSRLRHTGLTAVAIRQDALTDQQRLELGEFRLHQYALWGWYDIPTLASNGIVTDPALPGLPAETIHVLVGGPDARLLAYFCMQPASQSPTGQLIDESPETLGKPRTPTTLRDPWRLLFCMEVESFGPDVFPSLPALASLPVHTMRELSCLIRNQAITSPLSTIATIEAVYTMTHVVMQPESGIEATLGCIDVEARRVTAVLSMPFLYAPLAPVIREQFEFYWASGFVNVPGRFWPFVISTADLHKHADHFEMLDRTLSGSAWEVRRTLIQLHRNPPQITPHAFVPSADEAEVFWTDDPYYEQPLLKAATDPITVVPREVR